MKYLFALIIVIFCFGFTKLSKEKKHIEKEDSNQTIYDFKIKDIDGNEFDFNSLKDKIVLIVNVASKCGFTSQYSDLEKLYNSFKDDDFIIIGIPSNDFGKQEPGSNIEIKRFCETNFNITFPIMSKVNVRGKNIIPLYSFLTNKDIHPETGGEITWNFNKFLIDKNGIVIKRYSSFIKPLSKKITSKINDLIKGDKNEN